MGISEILGDLIWNDPRAKYCRFFSHELMQIIYVSRQLQN